MKTQFLKPLACAAFAALMLAPTLAGAMTLFLDTSGIHELQPQERLAISNPQPVQIIFQAQANGAANGRGTAGLKPFVIDDVKASGLFSDVTEAPVPSGNILSITLNDVFDLKGAESKGFLTGLTFGLAGSLVTDHDVCTIVFLSGTPGTAKITETEQQNIFTELGVKADPPNAEKMPNALEAAKKMLREVIGNGLNDLAYDHEFNPAAPPKPVPPAPAAAPQASATAASSPTPTAPSSSATQTSDTTAVAPPGQSSAPVTPAASSPAITAPSPTSSASPGHS